MRSAVIPVMSRYARPGTALHTYICIVIAITRRAQAIFPKFKTLWLDRAAYVSLLEPLPPMRWMHVHSHLNFDVYPAISISEAWKYESVSTILINNRQVQQSVGRH